jgi:hypothetical protein
MVCPVSLGMILELIHTFHLDYLVLRGRSGVAIGYRYAKGRLEGNAYGYHRYLRLVRH